MKYDLENSFNKPGQFKLKVGLNAPKPMTYNYSYITDTHNSQKINQKIHTMTPNNHLINNIIDQKNNNINNNNINKNINENMMGHPQNSNITYPNLN